MNFIAVVLVPLNVLFFVLADWFSVKWFESSNGVYMIFVALCAVGGYWLFGWLSHTTSLSVASGLVNTGIAVGTILLGVFVRHDALDLQQKIGVLVAILAIGLLTIHR